MMKIISIFDKHHDFIELQYKSILKHVRGDYEYIVFNNASTEEQSNLNKNVCDKLGIKCIVINVNYNQTPSNIAGDALNISFDMLPNEKIFKIDSDMFFISDVNINDLFIESDLIYIPTYQPNREIMWSGMFGINLDKIDIKLDFNPGVIPQTDTFGQSCLLTKNQNLSKKLFDLYNLQNIDNDVYITSLNNDCVIKLNNNNIIFNERPEFYNNQKKLNNLHIIYDDMVKLLKKYDFPKPYNVDMIQIDGINSVFHFKSANWCPWYTNEYVNLKKNSLVNFLKNT